MTMSPQGSRGTESGPLRPDARSAMARVESLKAEHDAGKAARVGKGAPAVQEPVAWGDELTSAGPPADPRPLGRARKVSVSLPEELTVAVQQRVGRGAFSQYVAEAVARQLELDLLAELTTLLDAEHGPVPEEALAEAHAAWPDAQ